MTSPTKSSMEKAREIVEAYYSHMVTGGLAKDGFLEGLVSQALDAAAREAVVAPGLQFSDAYNFLLTRRDERS